LALHLRIVIPLGEVVSVEVESIVIPSSQGQLEILPGHANLICLIEAGIISFVPLGAGKKSYRIVADGSCEVSLSGTCVVFAELCEAPDITSDRFRAMMVSLKEEVEKAGSLEDIQRSISLLHAFEGYQQLQSSIQ
jgi:F-type H+-transporting ATPase subunit epsilon